MARFLDWAIDVTQIASILALPVIALLFERRREEWMAYALGLYVVFIAVVAVAASLAGPERYKKVRGLRITLLSFIGVVVNVAIALILGLGLLRYGDYVESAADIVEVETVDQESSDPDARNVFIVRLRVQGGEEALAGRIPWIANTRFASGVVLGTAGAVSWAPRPCSQVSDLEWNCDAVYLGEVQDCDLRLNIFATLASSSGVGGIMDGWDDNPESGYFPPPAGVESVEPTPFERTGDDPGCRAS